jgi:hypothetical protein
LEEINKVWFVQNEFFVEDIIFEGLSELAKPFLLSVIEMIVFIGAE